MATYTSRKKVITRYEWIVPATWNGGAPWAEVSKAFCAAMRQYRTLKGWNDNISVSDDAVCYSPGDEEIVIWFEVEE